MRYLNRGFMISNRLETRRRELALLTEYRPACEKYLCRIGVLLFILSTSTQPVYAAINHRGELADLSLEELANIQITSVSKKAEALADAPASVFVITGEDIRRSGATSLPEALRLAPNLQVARVDARNYAVTARGFNSPFANKLLVLIDGRTVYSPLFSRVFWDAQDVVQDEVEVHKAVRLTVGMKLEHNNYTGMEFLPSVRLAWKPATHHLVWGSASRAVRAPSRIDRDFFAPPNPAVVNGVPQFFIGGGPDFVSEVINAYEIGYRVQPVPAISYSLTAFYNVHDKPDSVDATGESGLANNDPSHFWMLRSSYDISRDKEADFTLRHTGELPRPEVPSYTTMDLRFGWKIRPDPELSVVGQNLLNSSHAEFGAAATRSVFERRAILKLVWRI
jgi:outer membrane receptor protein involved in Fe transport